MSARHVAITDIYGVDDPLELSWMDHAVCVEVDPEAFFPGKGEASEPARAVCRSCEARLPCLAYALANPQQGVWGGFSEYRRVAVARQHLAGCTLADIIADDDAAYYGWAEARGGYTDPESRRLAAEREQRRLKREQAAA